MSQERDRRSSIFARFAAGIDAGELERPGFVTVLKVVWLSVRSFFTEQPAQIIGLTFILIMLWGTHGKLELLHVIWPDYRGPGIDIGHRPQLLRGIAWDNELISFWRTLVWGLAAGATAYAIRSIWPVVLAHWLLNVFLDGLIVGII